jgi:hypothetical protein
MPLSTILLLYFVGQFYWWRKLEDPEKVPLVVSSRGLMMVVEYYLLKLGKSQYSKTVMGA